MEQMYPIVIKRILQPLLLGLLVLTCLGGCRVDDAVSEIELNTDWLFKSRKDTLWAKPLFQAQYILTCCLMVK
jgi:hypothetical protein